VGAKHIIGRFDGAFRVGQDSVDPQIVLSAVKGNLRVRNRKPAPFTKIDARYENGLESCYVGHRCINFLRVLHVHVAFVFQAFVMTGDRMINLAKTPANIGTPSYHAVYYLSWALFVHRNYFR
jgi:hypothetical protein